MSECVFCLIRDRKIPSKIVYEDDDVLAFNDIRPEAPVHVVIIPKKHISSLNDISECDMHLIQSVFKAAQKISAACGIAESGYRIVSNCGKDAGQSVPHVHFHLLGGRDMQWPPG